MARWVWHATFAAASLKPAVLPHFQQCITQLCAELTPLPLFETALLQKSATNRKAKNCALARHGTHQLGET